MNTSQIILIILLSLTGYPLGLILAHFTEEELKPGRRWFKIIMASSIIAMVVSLFFLKRENLFFFISMMIFVFLLAFASYMKAKNRKKSKNHKK